jgi:hypothetical protein
VDVYAKNLPKDAVTVQLGGADNDSLAITIPEQQQQQQQQQGGGGGSGSAAAGAAGTSAAAAVTGAGTAAESAADAGGDYVLQLDLFGAVSPEVPPKVEVLRTKVEITLIKAQPNVHWPALEKGGKGPGAAGVAAAAPAAAAQAPAAAVSGAGQQQPSQQQQQQQQQGPPRVYPSSKGAKDWSKVEGEVTRGAAALLGAHGAGHACIFPLSRTKHAPATRTMPVPCPAPPPPRPPHTHQHTHTHARARARARHHQQPR